MSSYGGMGTSGYGYRSGGSSAFGQGMAPAGGGGMSSYGGMGTSGYGYRSGGGSAFGQGMAPAGGPHGFGTTGSSYHFPGSPITGREVVPYQGHGTSPLVPGAPGSPSHPIHGAAAGREYPGASGMQFQPTAAGIGGFQGRPGSGQAMMHQHGTGMTHGVGGPGSQSYGPGYGPSGVSGGSGGGMTGPRQPGQGRVPTGEVTGRSRTFSACPIWVEGENPPKGLHFSITNVPVPGRTQNNAIASHNKIKKGKPPPKQAALYVTPLGKRTKKNRKFSTILRS